MFRRKNLGPVGTDAGNQRQGNADNCCPGIRHAEAAKDGSLGYTFGSSEVSFRNEKGEIQKRSGRYLTVWRRQPDGSWKVVSDIGS